MGSIIRQSNWNNSDIQWIYQDVPTLGNSFTEAINGYIHLHSNGKSSTGMTSGETHPQVSGDQAETISNPQYASKIMASLDLEYP